MCFSSRWSICFVSSLLVVIVCPEDIVKKKQCREVEVPLFSYFLKDDYKARGNSFFPPIVFACLSCISAAAEYTATIQFPRSQPRIEE